ncbi:MAG TPA: bestrophin family ion channel [Polyangiaceae bacterium]|nr:bestrophin family ion channel [Polyangiaceae bacterium]
MIVYERRPTWLGLVFSVRGTELEGIRFRLTFVFLISIVFTYFQEVGHVRSPLTIPALSLMGMAIGIFLGFRNNTSYDRFWEGRRLWGGLVNTSRTLTRHLLTLTAPHGDSARVRACVHRIPAFVHALRAQLRDQPLPSELDSLLEPNERALVAASRNPANAILLQLQRELAGLANAGELTELRLVEITTTLATLTDLQGGCERIKNTPMPHSYSTLIHRIVGIYVMILPFGLVQTLHLLTPFVVLIVAYTFLGLDSVGSEIEDPFGEDPNDLPLGSLSRMIEINVREMAGEVDLPELLKPVRGQLT